MLQTALIALRCWWKIATPAGIFLAACAVAAVIRFVDPTYTATAWVLIRERPDYLVSQNAFSQDPRRQLQNQLELMKSPLVLNAVMQVPGVPETPELVDEEDQVATLRRLLKVRSQNNSDYFLVEFTSTSAGKAKLVVNSVAQKFLDEQQQNNSKRIQGLINSLTELRSDQEEAVRVLQGAYEAISRSQLGVNPFSADSEQNKTLTRNLAIEMKTALTVAERNRKGIEAQIASERSLLEASTFAPLESEVERRVRQDPQVLSSEAAIALDRKNLAGYESTAKDVALVAKRKESIAKAETALKESLVEIRTRIRDELMHDAQLVQQDKIKVLERELERAQEDVKFYQERLAEVQEGQKAFQGETFKVDTAKVTFDRAVQQLEAIDNRIQGMKMEQKAPPPAELFQEAAIPGAPDAELPFKQMGLAGAVALLLPFGVAVGVEYLRRRVSDRAQLEASGQIAVLGEVTALPRRRRTPQADSRSQRDLQLFEESIDGLRTFLTLRESMMGMKVLAVSSAVSREGKTSIAAQLAVSLASATGERTLLIDGDMRSPDVDKIFGVERGPGLVEVLQGEVPIEEAIETDFNDTLHLLTAGHLTTSPHRLLGNGEFAALLSELRASYHYIVVDTPPILPASESLVMARAADAAILCVRRDYSRLDQVAEAQDRLQHAGVKTAGAVLNGIPPRVYERRYGSYYYKRKSRS